MSAPAKKKDDLKGATASLIQILEDREKKLQTWEEDLSRREALLKAAANGAEPDDILHLNVGGRTGITVHRKTLTLIENSVLGAKFSKNWEGSLDKDKDGNIFVDQDPDLFLLLVSHLREKSNDVRNRGIESPAVSTKFDRLLEYYEVMMAVYPVEIRGDWWQRAGTSTPPVPPHHEHEEATVTNYPDWSISSTATCLSFDLAKVGHTRPIRSFQVVVVPGDVSQLQIGWRKNTNPTTAMPITVGRDADSMAVDIVKKSLLFRGTEVPQTNLHQIPTETTSTILFEVDPWAQFLTNQFTWSLIRNDDAMVALNPNQKHQIYAPAVLESHSLHYHPGTHPNLGNFVLLTFNPPISSSGTSPRFFSCCPNLSFFIFCLASSHQ
jgi:BTB/POZ domain